LFSLVSIKKYASMAYKSGKIEEKINHSNDFGAAAAKSR